MHGASTSGARLLAIDALRGLVMLAMLVDHVRETWELSGLFVFEALRDFSTDLPLGSAQTRSGAIMAAVDRFDIMVRGRGGHAA